MVVVFPDDVNAMYVMQCIDVRPRGCEHTWIKGQFPSSSLPERYTMGFRVPLPLDLLFYIQSSYDDYLSPSLVLAFEKLSTEEIDKYIVAEICIFAKHKIFNKRNGLDLLIYSYRTLLKRFKHTLC